MITFSINDENNRFFIKNILSNEHLAKKHLKNITGSKESFLTIKTDNDFIQFSWLLYEKWLVDIPYDMKNFNSLQKYTDYDGCVEIIELIFSGKSLQDINSLTKVNIKKETLDQILLRS